MSVLKHGLIPALDAAAPRFHFQRSLGELYGFVPGLREFGVAVPPVIGRAFRNASHAAASATLQVSFSRSMNTCLARARARSVRAVGPRASSCTPLSPALE